MQYCAAHGTQPILRLDMLYDGTFSGTLIEGEGVFANLLREQGFTLYTPKTIDALMKANTVSYESEHR